MRLLEEQIDSKGNFIVCGSEDDEVWREEQDVDEVNVEGEWSGGGVDTEWMRGRSNQQKSNPFSDDEEAGA
jgi:hypothetical protein